jgi:hypothetical protein
MPFFVFFALACASVLSLGGAPESLADNTLGPSKAQSCPAPLLICRRGRIGPASCFDPNKHLCDAGRLHPLRISHARHRGEQSFR